MDKTLTSPNGTVTTGELTSADMLDILKEKRKAYFRSRFDTDLEYRIAQRLEDDQLKERLLKQLKRIEGAINFINEEIAKVNQETV